MIICPNCKEEIEDDAHFCDQCGQALLYCKSCGRVGMGRRCTYCGGLMVSADELQKNAGAAAAMSVPSRVVSLGVSNTLTNSIRIAQGKPPIPQGVPMLTLYNPSLNIRITGINGAVIGRRQGPYTEFFQQNMFVSGVHAQLKYNAESGWCIVDKHSSNGTKLNQHPVQPDVEMSIKNGDIVTLANINLQVSVN